MPSRDQLESALRNADAAGDTEAATMLANALKNYSEDVSKPRDFSAAEMIKNVPESALQYAENLISPIIHPIDTAKGMYNIGKGVIEKGTRKLFEATPNALDKRKFVSMSDYGYGKGQSDFPNEQYADQVGEFIAGRYGSMDNFKNTVQTDPVGFLADLSLAVTAGGAAASRLPGVAGQVGQAAKTAGVAINPLNAAVGGSKYVASKLIPKGAPTRMYESAAKFSTTFPQEKRMEMAETALSHKIMPTSSGIDKMTGIIDDLDMKINGLIDDATAAGKTIPKGAIFTHINELRRKLGGAKISAPEDLAQINNVVKSLDQHLKGIGKSRLTPRELQELKTDAYNRINFDASQLSSGVGKSGAMKAVARGAKEAIEKVADVKDLNRELGKLLKLKDPLQRSAARIENRDVIGIGAPIKMATGATTGGAAGVAAGAGLSVLDHPKIKAALAIKLKDIQDKGNLHLIDHKMLPFLVKSGLLQAGRIEEITALDGVEDGN